MNGEKSYLLLGTLKMSDKVDNVGVAQPGEDLDLAIFVLGVDQHVLKRYFLFVFPSHLTISSSLTRYTTPNVPLPITFSTWYSGVEVCGYSSLPLSI